MITCCSGFASIQLSMSADGKRLNPRTSASIYLFLHGCHNLYFSASEPSSVFRRCIWIISSKPRRRYIFDDDLGHGNHSEVLLLFVGCIVNFIVSYLICMFQDSVPAGSYNDPFLSSVCVCLGISVPQKLQFLICFLQIKV